MTKRKSTLPTSSIVDECADFLIIGSGIAGLWAANKLADSGKVLVVR